jgi:hypothetical protein
MNYELKIKNRPRGLVSNVGLVMAILLNSAFLIFNSPAQVSTNKTFMLNNGTSGTTNNVLPPNETNFFVVNSNLLNAAVTPNGGSGGAAQTPWSQNINGNGNILSNAVFNNDIAGTLTITNGEFTNVYVGSNSYTGKTNFAEVAYASNQVQIAGAGASSGILFVNDSMKIGDYAGSMDFFNPTSTDYYFSGTTFGDALGSVFFGSAAMTGTLTDSSLAGPALTTVNSSGQFGATAFNGSNSVALSGANTWVPVGSGGGVTPTYSSQFQTVSLGTGTATNVTDVPTNFASLFPYVAGVSPVAIQGVDSETAGNGSGASGYLGTSNYLMFASNVYGLHFAASTNLAVGGEQIGTWSSNYTTILHPYAPRPGTNQFLFLWGGINDFGQGQTAERVFYFFTNISYLAHQDRMIVVGMTCTYSSTNSPTAAWEQYRFNNYLRNSPTNWDYLVDVAAMIPPPSLNSNLYVNNGSDGLSPDIVHITNSGQQFIGYEVSNVLSRAPHALTTKYQEGFFGALINTLMTNNNNPNLLYGNKNIVQSAGSLYGGTRSLNTPYAQSGTFAGAGFDSGTSAYAFSCYFSGAVNFYGWLTSADAGTEFMSYCAINGTNGVTFPKTSIYVQQSVVATNGFASCNTNVLTAAAATSWSGQYSTIDNGFTNTYGTNCTININGSGGYFVFWHSGGTGASAAAANAVFTNALSTNGWSRSLPINCGVQVFPLTGQANVTVDFGQ